MTLFADTIALEPAGENRWQGIIDNDYRGFGSQFGGWTGAALLKGAMVEPGVKGEPLSLSVLFIESVSEGGYEISTRMLRSGARLQFWRSELIQNSKVAAHAQATFGVRRDTTSFTDAVMPHVVPPTSDKLKEWGPDIPFGRQLITRWATPGPRDPAHDPSMPASSLVWMKDRRGRPLDVLMLAAMADHAPPRVIWKRPVISGSSTVSMTTHFHATADDYASVGDDFILSEVHCRRCEGSYFDHELKLWSRGGVLLATSEQVAAFRD
ncbi:MAG TPA: thioesterase family protein [Hyphomonadaceae bacterium]|nr:thioesterase family protein [Hyphomonadaceae bacterium]